MTRTSGCWIFPSSPDQRLDGALDVALEDDVEVLHGAGLHLLEERLERHARRLRALRELLAAEALGALLGDVLRLALVLDDPRELTCGRRAVEAEDLDGLAGMRLLDLLAAIVVERAHLAGGVAGDDRVADAQRAALDEHRRDGPAADVETRLDDRARRLGVRVRAEVELGVRDEQDLLEQLLEVRLLLGRDRGELRVAAPVLRLEALGGELRLHPVGVRVGHVDLVDRDDDRHLGRARVVDRLLRLRHDAVVGGDDEHGDVGHLRAAGAHGGERLVARRVEEGQLPAVDLGLVRADVLRDAAGLGLDHGRGADRVEQCRLAVVDVAHDRDDRRARREVRLGVLDDLGLVLVGRVLDRDLALDLGRDQLDLVVGERLRRGPHLAEAHQGLDDLRHRHAERGREVLDGDARLDRDGPGRRAAAPAHAAQPGLRGRARRARRGRERRRPRSRRGDGGLLAHRRAGGSGGSVCSVRQPFDPSV